MSGLFFVSLSFRTLRRMRTERQETCKQEVNEGFCQEVSLSRFVRVQREPSPVS